ncbi:putative Type I protein exporter [Helianthus annuus]|nr:putative Type I protein exporter [Helianthus annuus]
MSNMIEVFYFDTPARMERKTKEYVFIYVGAGLYAVVAYLIQHYFFSIMGDNLTTRVRRMIFSAILRNEVGWFDEEDKCVLIILCASIMIHENDFRLIKVCYCLKYTFKTTFMFSVMFIFIGLHYFFTFLFI